MGAACGVRELRGSGRRASGASIWGADPGDVARGAGVVTTDANFRVGDGRSDVACANPGACAASPPTTSPEDDILARTPTREGTGGSDRARVLPARDLQPEVDPSPVGTKLPASETRPAERSHNVSGTARGG